MRVTVDRDKCCGYGDCVLAAPDLFDLGDDGVAQVRVADPADSLRATAEQAAAACPVEAIVLT